MLESAKCKRDFVRITNYKSIVATRIEQLHVWHFCISIFKGHYAMQENMSVFTSNFSHSKTKLELYSTQNPIWVRRFNLNSFQNLKTSNCLVVYRSFCSRVSNRQKKRSLYAIYLDLCKEQVISFSFDVVQVRASPPLPSTNIAANWIITFQVPILLSSITVKVVL